MPDITTISRRLTHRYIPAYAHLDKWEEVGKASILPLVKTDEGNGFDDVGTYRGWVKLHRDMPRRDRDTKSALWQTLADIYGSTCTHEYDCCGCISGHVNYLQFTGPRTLTFQLHVTRNY